MNVRTVFDLFLDKIRPHLLEYLELKGYNTHSAIRCINPDHDDHSPSMLCANAADKDWRVWCLSCLRENELVWTTSGIKRLVDIEIGDKVLTHKGNWHPVIAKKEQQKDTISIKTDAVKDSIRLTPDHQCIFLRKEDAVENLSCLRNDPSRGKVQFIGRAQSRKPIEKYINSLPITNNRADRVVPGDFLLFPTAKPSETLFHPCLTLPKKSNRDLSLKSQGTNRISSLPLDCNSGYFYGLYLAEGHSTDRTVTLTFYINEKDTLCASGLIWAQAKGLRASVQEEPNKNRCNLVIDSADLSELVEFWFGTDFNNKTIPAEFMNMPKEFLYEVLRGYIDGNRFRSDSDTNTKTVSEKLAFGVFSLAVQTGKFPSLQHYSAYIGKDGQEHSEYWTIRFRKEESLGGFYETINDTKYYVSQVTEVGTRLIKEKVVDISVLGDESFTCKVGAVHNCGWRGDIFDVYSALEDKPKRGAAWFNETVLPLATMFNIPPPVVELSVKEQFRHDLYRVFEDTAALIEHRIDKFEQTPKEYVLRKKWTEETLTALDIGTISYETIQKRIPEEDRRRFGLNRPDVFNEEHLIFTVRDQFGRPVRFFARRPDTDPKFISTTSSGLVSDVWSERGVLYLSNLCTRTSSTSLVVEGHPDAVTLYQAGITNVVGLCGCGMFSENHTDSLTMSGISKCILMYDGDEDGQRAVERLLRKPFVTEGGLTYEVVVLPEEHDPDSYLRVEGSDKFNNLLEQRLSAFEFLLLKEDPSQTPEEVCERLIPYIAANKSDVKREMMARDLVRFTGDKISIGAVLADVNRIDDVVVSAIMEKQKAIVTSVTRQVQNHTAQAKEVYRGAVEQLEAIEKEQGGRGSKAACLARIQACKMVEENRSTGGYNLKEGSLGSISHMLDGGDWRGSKIIIVAGVRNVGKSTMVDNFLWEAITQPDNNAIAYLLTIDDPAEARFRRMGCCAVRSVDFTQNMMANPNYYFEEKGIPDVYEKREYAYSRLTEMIASGKLIVEDSRDGTTLAYAERRIAQIRRENPESNIIFGLDNFHDCTDWGGAEAKDRVGKQIKYGKRICEIHKALGVFTAEYRKLADPMKPGTDDDLADSRAMQYAPHLTMHLFSDLDAKGEDKALLVHDHHGLIMPRVVLNIGKNKITSTKGNNKLVYDFYPAAALFKNVPIEQAKKDEKERRDMHTAHKLQADAQAHDTE